MTFVKEDVIAGCGGTQQLGTDTIKACCFANLQFAVVIQNKFLHDLWYFKLVFAGNFAINECF